MQLLFLSHKEEEEGMGEVTTTTGRMMGIDTGNPATDFEAGMWLMALVATLAAAVPVAFLSPDLGFKRKRRRQAPEDDFVTQDL